MPRSNTRPIDGEKLRKELERRGLTLTETAERLGHGKSYMNHVLTQGYIAEPNIILLEAVYNLRYDAYEPDPEPEEEKPLEGQMRFELPAQISKKDLWEVIYTAVKKALEEANDNGTDD